MIFQGIHMIFNMDKSEEEWGEVRENRICFIGRNLDKEFITAEIMKCVVKEGELRFKIGDRVECNMGKSLKDAIWC